MFKELIGTRPTRDRSMKGAIASATFHGMLFATLIIASAQRDTEIFSATPDRVIVTQFREPTPKPPSDAPPAPAPPAPVEPKPPTLEPPTEVPTAPTEIPTEIPKPGTETTLPSEPAPVAPSTSEPGTGDPSGEPSYAPTGALTAFEVDRPVTMLRSSPLPRYPDVLRSSRLEGGVRVVFVVDANGRVEMESVRFVEATHPLFVEAVRSVLPRMRFRPAQSGSRRVRQLVEIPFGFTLTGR